MANVVEIIYKARDEVTGVAKQVQQSAGGVGAGFDKSRLAMMAFNAIGASVTVATLSRMITSTAALANRMAELQASTGISGVALSRWKAVAENSGTSLESLVTAMRALSTQAYQDGEAFAKLGIRVRESDGTLRPLEALLNETIRALQGTSNATERMALATRTLGRGALDLAPMLGMTTAELEAMQRQADITGATMSQRLIDAAKKWDDELDRSSDVMKGFRNAMAESVLGPLTNVVKAFNDAVIAKREWEAEANKALPNQWTGGAGSSRDNWIGGVGVTPRPPPVGEQFGPDPRDLYSRGLISREQYEAMTGRGGGARGPKLEDMPIWARPGIQLYPQLPTAQVMPGELAPPRLMPEFQRIAASVPQVQPPEPPGRDFGQWGEDIKAGFVGAAANFGASIQEMIQHSKSFGDGLQRLTHTMMKQFLNAILSSTAAIIAEAAARKAGGFLKALLLQHGGMVPQPAWASPYRDSVPAMLQPGEMVIPKSIVQSLSMRRASVMGGIAHFQGGGLVRPERSDRSQSLGPTFVALPYMTQEGTARTGYYPTTRLPSDMFGPGSYSLPNPGFSSAPGASGGASPSTINASITVAAPAYGTHLDRMRFAFDVREALESLQRNTFSNMYPLHT